MVGAADHRRGRGLVRELGGLPRHGRAARRHAVRALAGEVGPGTYAYDVQRRRRPRRREDVEPPGGAPPDGTQTEHGFVSMTPWSDERDGHGVARRAQDGAAPRTARTARRPAEMALVHTTMGARRPAGRGDGPRRPRVRLLPDRHRAGGDAAVVVYRDRSEKEVRDMSVVRFAGGRWSAPRTLAADGWEINGCPVNGPAVAADGARGGRGVVHRRRRQAEGEGRVLRRFRRDVRRPDRRRRRPPAGPRGRGRCWTAARRW